MTWKRELTILLAFAGAFLACFYLPVGAPRFDNAVHESLLLVRWYAREHVLLCLVPAFFIAGAISTFVSQASVMKYLGAGANKVLAYGVASISGTILAVCSCTVLPVFGGIYRMGAGLGPATTFLYSGPAINVLAIVLTARVLGLEMGIARAVGAIAFSVVVGLLMHVMFRKEEAQKAAAQAAMPVDEPVRPLWQTGVYFAAMVGVLVFANWGAPATDSGLWFVIHEAKWLVTGLFAAGLGLVLVRWFGCAWWKVALVGLATVASALYWRDTPLASFAVGILGLSWVTLTGNAEGQEWLGATWQFAKQILPLLLGGVLVAGLLLGSPGGEGLIPAKWVSSAVGGNSLAANAFAAVVGAAMYFATLTEVPILSALMGAGMGKGPALALLLAGPALSLPNLLVIRSIMGTKKTVAYGCIVVVMATVSGVIFGAIAA